MTVLAPTQHARRTRLGLRVTGAVQGVGFRPFIHRLAVERHLGGFVHNDAAGVTIEIEGEDNDVRGFADEIRRYAPPLARIEGIESAPLAIAGESRFRIDESRAGVAGCSIIPADTATCAACLRELLDPADRRYRYPFINCTDCGPRFSIVRDVPYDRHRTTMVPFTLCRECRGEYDDPRSRRFHAEPNACPACGPRLAFVRDGETCAVAADALQQAISDLRTGKIVAIKSLGGFHLAVDATSESAIGRLRVRKHRPHKPLALMARDAATIRSMAFVSEEARHQLESAARPIVLLPLHEPMPALAPNLAEIGMMLPYTPLHHLLMQELPLLVMTSGNRSNEPIAIDNDQALAQLRGIADSFLTHDRAIHTRADDSVIRIIDGTAQPIRRSRGFVPEPIALPLSGPLVLAVGAELKNTVCFTRGNQAFLSPHIGDLGNSAALASFEETIEKHRRLLGIEPQFVAHDLHPDYQSTRWALRSALPQVAVQHHHAHIAACLAENGRTGDVIGVAFDGTGCGPDGEIWGGEILIASLRRFSRVGHLRPLPLPGGEAAIREPWRLAVAALIDAGEELDLLARVDRKRLDVVHQMIAKRVSSPMATSAGRWFDAVAALCGTRDEITYEAQAAAELEAIAGDCEGPSYPLGDDAEIDLRPTIRAIVSDLNSGVPSSLISARFHETMSQTIVHACVRAADLTGIRDVALSGGCFQNKRLTERTKVLLEDAGFIVLTHHRVPANDGGIAFGQAAVALAQIAERELGRADHVSRHSG